MSAPLYKMTSPDTISKVLPAVPDMDTQLAMADKMIDKKTATHKVSMALNTSLLTIHHRAPIAMDPASLSIL